MNLPICPLGLLVLFSLASVKSDCDVTSVTTASGPAYNPPSKLCPGDLIFEDTFETFDLSKWQHEVTMAGGGNGEFEYYRNNRTNSFTQDGNLHIKPTYLADEYGEDFLYSGTLDITEECTNSNNNGCLRTGTATNILNPIESARIRTLGTFSFKYGTVEARAKVPGGDWLWPAIWLLPSDYRYGGWPVAGEVDLVETRGNRNLTDSTGLNIGTELAFSTLEWGPSMAENQYMKTHWVKSNPAGYNNDFHLYKLVWSPEGFWFYYDDELIGNVNPPDGGFWEFGGFENSGEVNPWSSGTKMAPFDVEFHLLINLAIGATTGYFPDNANNPGGKPWRSDSSTAMTDFWQGKSQWEPTWNRDTDDSHFIVDYIRVFAI